MRSSPDEVSREGQSKIIYITQRFLANPWYQFSFYLLEQGIGKSKEVYLSLERSWKSQRISCLKFGRHPVRVLTTA